HWDNITLVTRSPPLRLVRAVSPFPLPVTRTAFIDPKPLNAPCSWQTCHVAQNLYPCLGVDNRWLSAMWTHGPMTLCMRKVSAPVLGCLRAFAWQRGRESDRRHEQGPVRALTQPP